MAGGNNKKKKKPVANPARGFATTSIVSKQKAGTLQDNISTDASEVGSPATAPTSVASEHVKSIEATAAGDERELHELSPEELEAQLEISELQQLVEKHAVKTRKEASRQVSRLQIDRRILRGQAEQLSVREWLPDELMQQILELTLQEAQGNFSKPEQAVARTPLTEDALLAKVWQLRLCLLELDIPSARVEGVLKYLISHPPSEESATQLWGLPEALDWLALRCRSDELLDYDTERSIQARYSAANSRPETPVQGSGSPAGAKQGGRKRPPRKKKDSPLSNTETDSISLSENDLEVSDMESDLEPSELVSVYLRTKVKLYELNPTLDTPSAGKTKAPRRGQGNQPQPPQLSAGERKLQQKIKTIESDLLFDQQEASVQWQNKRVELDREAAERKRLQLSTESDEPQQKAEPIPSAKKNVAKASDNVVDEAESIGAELLQESQDAEDGELLGGMFDALPTVEQPGTPSTAATNGAVSAEVRIQDFGKTTGMSPKRVLEEACRARNLRCRLTYKLVSPTTYASRNQVIISWTKEQEVLDGSYIPSVDVDWRPKSVSVTMTTVATPDETQSESYAATAALFVVFSNSPKEEKSHLRLPPAFRDLWDIFAELKRNHGDIVDRETIKNLRHFIQENVSKGENAEDDDVVFSARIRNRSQAASGTATPSRITESADHTRIEDPQHLREIWARKSSTPSYQRMLVGRMNLPMFRFRGMALDTIARSQVTIICGETGCGKSTQLPAFLLENELSQGRPCKIYCTEPRRISAISLAQRVSEEMGEHRGDVGTPRSLVGYAIRLESHTSAQTRLVYATVGIVLRMLESSKGLDDITHLVIDEIHERSIDTDFLLIVLRSLMVRRPDLKVVLMSATVDAQRFSNYLDNAPIVQVPGRTFPVAAKFLEDAIQLTGHTNDDASTKEQAAADDDDEEGMGDSASVSVSGDLSAYNARTRATLSKYDEYRIDYNLIVKLLEKVAYSADYSPFSKAVLVFLPGIAEIRQLNDMLVGHPSFTRGWLVYPLHSTFSSEEQQAAFEVPPDGLRKIVLATNIAETGITIPDVTCVIDTGKHKEMRFDERRQLSRLIQSFIARANAKQRRGRAGRVQEGICFHLFTKYRHDELMAEQQTPEMLRLSLQDLVMRVKICKLGDIEQALSAALDPPSSRNIRRAIDALVEVNALTPREELTPLGQQLAKLPLDAQLGKLILLASIYGCLDFALTAAAMLSSKSPFLAPMNAKKQADSVRLGFKKGDSDLLTAYNAYNAWRRVCTTPGLSEYSFCNKNFLSPQNLANIEDLKGQLLSSLVDAGFVKLASDERSALSRVRGNSRQRNFVSVPSSSCAANENELLVNSVVAWSFYPKLLTRDGKGWRNVANNQSVSLHPTSVNKAAQDHIRFLSFYSIMQSSSRFTNAQETSAVSDFAIMLMAGDAVFNMYAGVIVIDGNRLRFKVRDWKTMILLKTLRARAKDYLSRSLKSPGKELGDRQKQWVDIFGKLFERNGERR